jgi:hypothetical protein
MQVVKGDLLYSMIPDKIKIRKFSDANFDTDKYLEKQSLKLYSRLAQIENSQGIIKT